MLQRILDLVSDLVTEEDGLEMVEWALTGALLLGVSAIIMRQIGLEVTQQLNRIFITLLTLP